MAFLGGAIFVEVFLLFVYICIVVGDFIIRGCCRTVIPLLEDVVGQ